MSDQELTLADRLNDACTRLTDAEATIMFVCMQVAEGKMTPELALLKIHVGVLPAIVGVRNGVSWVKDDLRAAEALTEGDTKK